MKPPVFAIDNLYDDLTYTGHTVTANEEASDHEAFLVANGRRLSTDHWRPTTANNDAWIEVACDRPRAADFIAIDRGHNLAGKTVALEISDDNYTTTETVFSITFPSSYFANSPISAASGARTEEGAWVKTFTLAIATYWRLKITAAASYTPNIVGLTLGKAWQVTSPTYPTRPWDEDAAVGAWTTTGNEFGWSANSAATAARTGTVTLPLDSYMDYDRARRFAALYRMGRPAWYVPDADAAERAMFVRLPQGRQIEGRYEDGHGYRQVVVPYSEHEPRITE